MDYTYRVAHFLAQASPISDESELLKILVQFVLPFVTAGGAIYLSGIKQRKEMKNSQITIEAAARAEMSAERNKLSDQWEGTTERLSALVDAVYRQLEAATKRAIEAESESSQLKKELAKVKEMYEEAKEELDRVRRLPLKKARAIKEDSE